MTLTSADVADNTAAAEEIKKVAGKLDVLIANAGIAKYFGTILDTPLDEILCLAAAKASPQPKFALISSIAGSIGVGATFPAGFFAYGSSKAGTNFLAMKLHSEHPELVSIDIHPGPVQTDMGSFSAKEDPFIAKNMSFISVEESVKGILPIVDGAKREAEGPKMIGYDGSYAPSGGGTYSRLDPSTAKELQELEAVFPNRLNTIKLLSADKDSNETAIAMIKEVSRHLDVVISNAGICDGFEPTSEVSLDAMKSHFEVNVLGPLALFQAAYPLLKASAKLRFPIISSMMGSIQHAGSVPSPATAYSVSKEAGNWLAARLHYEYPEISESHVATSKAASSASASESGSLIPVQDRCQCAVPC
ncbi:NAD(P)-binding protein [Calocera cornea HHB12733]|uniref:NAD(P)-binding protein n=1 Tax=Calocera cornea HHB12733 TaxID=1353952 RepID=A0A165E903_9BASI|nr:NAD(P)-binding protein [Calocera cornea HHB12733]